MSVLLASASAQYLSVPNEADYDLTTGISITCWMRHTGLWKNVWEVLVAKGDNAWRFSRLSAGAGRGLHWATDGLSSPYLNWDGVVDDDAWHFVGATFQSGSPGSKHLLVDGAYVLSDLTITGTISDNAFQALVGENAQAVGRYFDGDLWDTRIYNRGLSFTELLAIWRQRGGDTILNGLVSRWIGNQVSPGGVISSVNDRGAVENDAAGVASPVASESIVGFRRRRAG